MFRKLITLSLVVLLVAAFAGSFRTAQAYADVSSTQESCSSFFAQGKTNSPYVWMWVGYYDANGDWVETWEAFAANADGTFNHGLSFPEQPQGTWIMYEVWGAPSGSVDLGEPGYWDDGDYYDSYHRCVPNVPGPSAPSSFVLHTIICDTALFGQPGGSPVADAKITAGQTWYVNPTPKTAADGSSWTEIFVGGYTNAYIPTACVG